MLVEVDCLCSVIFFFMRATSSERMWTREYPQRRARMPRSSEKSIVTRRNMSTSQLYRFLFKLKLNQPVDLFEFGKQARKVGKRIYGVFIAFREGGIGVGLDEKAVAAGSNRRARQC